MSNQDIINLFTEVTRDYLANLPTCQHERESFMECKNGETWWKCDNCGNMRPEYHDTCSGG